MQLEGRQAVYTSFADAIYGFTSLNFWVKAEKLSDEDRTDGASTQLNLQDLLIYF